MNERPTITRYTAPPTKFEVQPRGTLCVVIKNDEGTEKELYMQTSHNSEDPVWMSARELLVESFSEYLTVPQFISNLMDLRERKLSVKNLTDYNQSDPGALKPQDP
jgi:hypothetical protein